jgi:hypothetical protein
VINKSNGTLNSNVTVGNFLHDGSAARYRYSSDNLNAIVRLEDATISHGVIAGSFPKNSITLYVLHRGLPPTITPTPTETSTLVPTTIPPTATPTFVPTAAAGATATPTPTMPTALPVTDTATPSTVTPTATPSPTVTPTPSPSATASATPIKPAAPSELVATGLSPTQIGLTWRDTSDNESGFHLIRRTSNETQWIRVATLPPNTTSYLDSDAALGCNIAYLYRIRAYGPTGNSAYSNTATAQVRCTTGPIFADDFETGDIHQWSTTINGQWLTVDPAAALGGAQGLAVSVESNTAAYLTDNTPYGEKRYRLRFYLDPNSLTMAHRDLFLPFYAQQGNKPIILRIDLRYLNGNYQVRTGTLLNHLTWQFTPFYTISDEPHSIELDWQAATAADTNDGSLALWIDGELKRTLAGLANDTRQIDRARLGMASVDPGTRGTFYLDELISHRDAYIGPATTMQMSERTVLTGTLEEQSDLVRAVVTAPLSSGVETTLQSDLDGLTATVVVPPLADSNATHLVLRAVDDDTLPEGYRRIGDALAVALLTADSAPALESTAPLTVTFFHPQFDDTMIIQRWDATNGVWVIVPATVDREGQMATVVTNGATRLALMQPESFEAHQILLPLVYR